MSINSIIVALVHILVACISSLHALSPLSTIALAGASEKEFGGNMDSRQTMPADVGPVDARQTMSAVVRHPYFRQTISLLLVSIDNSSSVCPTAHWTPIKVEQTFEMLEMVQQATPSGRSLPHRLETTYCSSNNNIDIIISSP